MTVHLFLVDQLVILFCDGCGAPRIGQHQLPTKHNHTAFDGLDLKWPCSCFVGMQRINESETPPIF